MHIAAMVISIICGIMNIFVGGIGMLFGGVGYGVAEFIGEDSADMSAVTGMGALCLIAAIIGIIGGVFAALKKKPGWVLLAITTGFSLMAGLAVQGGLDAGFNDAYIYTLAYALATFLAYKSSTAVPAAATIMAGSPSASNAASVPIYGRPSETAGTPSQTRTGWKCAACGKENAGEWKFCSACGKERIVLDRHCPACGIEVPEGGRFCPACGTPVTVAAGASVEETSTSQPVVARAEPVSTETAVAKKNNSTGAFVAVAVCMIAVAFFALVPEARESLMSIFGNRTKSATTQAGVAPKTVFGLSAQQVENVYVKYVHAMVNAINGGDFGQVSSFLLEGSPLWDSQIALVNSLVQKGITENVVEAHVIDIRPLSDNSMVLKTKETITIRYPSGKTSTKSYYWNYKATYSGGCILFSDIEKPSS